MNFLTLNYSMIRSVSQTRDRTIACMLLKRQIKPRPPMLYHYYMHAPGMRPRADEELALALGVTVL